MKIFLCLYVFMICANYPVFAHDKILPVIPQPKEYRFTGEKFQLENSSIQIKIFCKEDESLSIAKKELTGTLKISKNVSVLPDGDFGKQILIGLPEENKKFNQICIQHNLLPLKKLGEEGYKILIDSSRVIISANNSKGLFYGIQTLKQIIRGIKDPCLPGVIISDWPSLKYRGVMDDISRGPVPTINFIKYQIRRLAEMKINIFMHYVEHVVKTKSHPEFAPVDGSITIDEWKELSEYAAKYNITLAGGFQSFGHFNNILSTPKYSHLGESGTLISPVNPESYKFLNDIYSEMVPAFKAPFFNINCDETFDLGKGASKKLVDSIGYAGVYYQHILKLHDILKKLNTKVMMWGDILLEYPELLRKLPKDIIIATWTYDNLDSYSKFIDPVKDAGFKFFAASGVLNSGKIFPNYKQAVGNIKGFAAAAEKSGALGMINTVWDDGGTALFANDWYGVSYAADKSWNPQSQDSANFDYRFNAGIYGAKNNSFTLALWKLIELAELEPTDGMNDKVLFEKLLPDSGKQIRISTIDWRKVLNITEEAEAFLKKTKLNNYVSDKEYLMFICELYHSLAQERFDLTKAAGCYAKTDSLITRKPSGARKALVESVCLLNRITEKEYVLNSTYEKLWLKENHTYALDKVTGNYKKKIDGFNIVKDKVIESLKRFDSGQPLLSKEETGLAVSELPGKYFREWLMVNPLPKKEKQKISHIDYLSAIGGEAGAVPKVTQEFYYDSVKYRWSRVASKYEDVLNLNEIFPEDKQSHVTYAFASIESGKDTAVKALLGFNDGIEIFINGNKTFYKEASGNFSPDEYSFLLPLHKGTNNLMLKLSRTGFEWNFTFRLPDCEVRSRKNRYKIIDN